MKKLQPITISELTGLNVGQLYELLFLKTRAAIEKRKMFCGHYKMRELYVNMSGQFLIEPDPFE